MTQNDLEMKMLRGKFLLFSNHHAKGFPLIPDDEVADIIHSLGLQYMFLTAINAHGVHMSFFLIPMEKQITLEQLYDLEQLIDVMLEQKYCITRQQDGKIYLQAVATNTKLAVTNKLLFFEDMPEKDYYLTPMGNIFSLNLTELL